MIRSKAKRLLDVGFLISRLGKRTILTKGYYCEEAWENRLLSPILRNLKMEQHFVETDKKFNVKNAVRGVNIDLFANNVQDPSQLEELEHLLFRFRKTQRSVEMMDSTIHATIRTFLQFKDYEGLFRILKNPENYGVFPDCYAYNILMDHFIKENMFKEATEVAILLMLQEDFSNKLNCLLSIYSCHMFMKNCPLESLLPQKEAEVENNENDDDEELLERVPFLRNPFFDDHFHLTEPNHLIGKTLFLAGRQMVNDPIGATYQLYGLALYEKWDKLSEVMRNVLESDQNSLLINEAIVKINELMASVEDANVKENITNLSSQLQKSNKILAGNLEEHLKHRLDNISSLEEEDISLLKRLFQEWEENRIRALNNQALLLDKQRRQEEIAKKKEYLFWKEKLLFFFENENKVLEEYQQAQEVIAQARAKMKEEDAYVPPEIIKRPSPRLTKFQKLVKVKQL